MAADAFEYINVQILWAVLCLSEWFGTGPIIASADTDDERTRIRDPELRADYFRD